MEKQILLDQIDSTLIKAIDYLKMENYITFRDGVVDRETATYWKNMVHEFSCLVNIMYDIQYNNNIEHYKDEIYAIARDKHGQ